MASIGSLEVSLTLNAANFNGAIAQVDRSMRAMGSELQALQAKGSKYENSIAGMTQKKNILNRSFDAAGVKLQEQRRRYDELVASGTATTAQIERQANAVNRAQTDYNRLERELAEVTEQLRVQSSQWTQVGQRMQDAGNKMKAVGDGMMKAGKSLSLYVTAPLVAMGTGAFKTAVDFETAFAGVRKTVDTTEEGFAKLEQGIRDMAKAGPTSASQLSEIAEAAGQLGIAEENILSFTSVMSDLDVSTNMTATEVASQLARLANITGMSQKDFDKLGSSIVALGNNFATTESEIVAMSLRLAGTGNMVGMSEAQIAGLATAMSSVGIEAEAGGTAMSTVMKKIDVAVANGADAVGYFAEVSNASVEEFSEKWKSNPVEALDMFIKGLAESKEEGENLTEVLQLLGIKGIRESDTILRLVGATDLLSAATKLSTEAWDENTALSKEAAQRYATTQSQMEMLKNKIVDMGITLGNILIPMVLSVTEKIQPWIDKFAALSTESQKTILVIGGIAAAIPPLLIVGGALISGIGSIVTAVGAVSTVIGAAGGAATVFGGALAVLTGPIGLTVAAVAGLGIAAYAVSKELKESSMQVDLFGEGVSKATAKAVGGFLELHDDATVALNQLNWSGQRVTQDMATKIVETFNKMGDQVLAAMQEDHAAQLQTMQTHFSNSSALTEEEENKIIEKIQEKHAEQASVVENGKVRIAEILDKAKNENRRLTELEQKEINAIQHNMTKNAVKYMSESEMEQKVILERLKNESSKISAQQAAEVVKNSKKQKDEVVKEANEQYNKAVAEIIRQRDEMGTISEEQAEKLIKEAERQKNDTIRTAEVMHENVVKEAKAQAKEHVDQVNWETGEVLSKWEKFKGDVGRKWNEITSNASKKWQEMKTDTVKKYEEMKNDAVKKAEELKTNVAQKFQEAKENMMKPIEEAKAKIEGWIGDIKGFFSNLILKIPEVSLPKLPKFSLTTSTKEIMGKSITYPTGFDVNWYDKGGIFYGPSIIGVGEKRPEFVGALDDLHDIVKKAMVDVVGGGNSGGHNINNSKSYNPVVNNNFYVPVPSPTDVARKNLQTQRQLAMEWGIT